MAVTRRIGVMLARRGRGSQVGATCGMPVTLVPEASRRSVGRRVAPASAPEDREHSGRAAMQGDMVALRSSVLVVHGLAAIACTPTRRMDAAKDDGSTTVASTGTLGEPSTGSPGTSGAGTHGASTGGVASSGEGSSSGSGGGGSTGSQGSGGDTSASGTTEPPPPYGTCDPCGPDEVELDGGPWCICAPPCRVADDCPDPATGATPACSSEGHICVLLCTSSEQCPEGAQCPDPASLPEGAQGFCYRDET